MLTNKIDDRVKKYIVIAALLGIASYAVFGPKGLLKVYSLKKERNGISGYNLSLANENRDLEDKIRLLKTDKRYIGAIARRELGMIGKDEVVYKLEGAEEKPAVK